MDIKAIEYATGANSMTIEKEIEKLGKLNYFPLCDEVARLFEIIYNLLADRHELEDELNSLKSQVKKDKRGKGP